MPLVRTLAVIATIFWFSPVREDGAGAPVAPSVPPAVPIASGHAPAPAASGLDRLSLAGLIAEAGDDAARAQALWEALPEEARSALARRIADEIAGAAPN